MEKRLLKISLIFVRIWYCAWLSFAVLTMILLLFLGFQKYEAVEYFYRVLRSVPFTLECLFYVLLSNLLQNIFFKSVSLKKTCTKISILFLGLFVLDLSYVVLGIFTKSGSKDFLVTLLEIIPQDSSFYEFYSNIYRYIPVVFYFFKPQISGTALLVLAAVSYYLGRPTNRDSGTSINLQK